MSKDYELQDVTLWPNVLSLDENLQKERKRIRDLITSTKEKFFNKNEKDIPMHKIIDYLDPDRDIYYPPKQNEPSYCKAGLHYSIPDHVVGIGLKVDPKYQNDKEWAVLYHATKPHSVIGIVQNGLRPGGGQAHRGTKDPWGETVPNGVYFSFWLNQTMGYTYHNNPIVMETFVNQVYVAPGCKGYAVSNSHRVSRILIPLQTKRHQQYL